jgi:hypothetical protein
MKMNSTKRFTAGLLLVVLVWSPVVWAADQTLSLKKDFINQVMDRATVDTDLRIDEQSPLHSISEKGNDGDIHMAGRDNVIKLPLVAELLNARFEPDVTKLLKKISDGEVGSSVNVTGIWRIWFEHPGPGQVQGQTVPAPSGSNPDHVFELHPLTRFGSFDCLDSFVNITNPKASVNKVYKAYSATRAFGEYEKLEAAIKATSKRVLLATSQIGFNYTEFVIELAGKPKDMGDSLMVLARIYDSADPEEPVVETLHRMVFVKGSPPAAELQGLEKGDTLHVLGIPRVNLKEVMAVANKNGANETVVPLPYEMIIVAVLKE